MKKTLGLHLRCICWGYRLYFISVSKISSRLLKREIIFRYFISLEIGCILNTQSLELDTKTVNGPIPNQITVEAGLISGQRVNWLMDSCPQKHLNLNLFQNAWEKHRFLKWWFKMVITKLLNHQESSPKTKQNSKSISPSNTESDLPSGPLSKLLEIFLGSQWVLLEILRLGRHQLHET